MGGREAQSSGDHSKTDLGGVDRKIELTPDCHLKLTPHQIQFPPKNEGGKERGWSVCTSGIRSESCETKARGLRPLREL